jgi:uroporphyrinogen III methyltransferase/synthase
LQRALVDGSIDAVTFASSNTVRNFLQLGGGAEGATLPSAVVVACIGPMTAQTAEEVGLRVDVVAKEHTIPGLVQALVDYYHSRAAEGI